LPVADHSLRLPCVPGPQLMSRPHFVFACDAAYAMPLATTLRSLTESNLGGWPLEISVLADGLSDSVRQRICDSLPELSARITWFSTDSRQYAELHTSAYISKVTFARLQIPSTLADATRALYLDADTLVLNDLGPLWQTNLGGAYLGAVVDSLDSRVKGADPRVAGVPRVRDYFNAGVLLIDLDRWRRDRVSERAVEYLFRFPNTPFADQDALNVACDGCWKQLDPHWNFQDPGTTRIDALPPDRRPAIVHFITVDKPWDAASLHVNAAFYDAYRARTRFARGLGGRLRDAYRMLRRRLERFVDRKRTFRAR
jgi:lipopolysaccharide biosynthesis glycosyltransferase